MLDFTIAKMNHQMWKRKLLKHVTENAPVDEKEMVSEKDCQLGKWLYSEGIQKYNDVMDIHNLERIHKELHQLTFSIVKDKQNQDLEAAKKGLDKLSNVSDQIVEILDILEIRLKE